MHLPAFFGADSKTEIVWSPERPESQRRGMMERAVYMTSCSQCGGRGGGVRNAASSHLACTRILPDSLPRAAFQPPAPRPQRLVPEHARHSCLLLVLLGLPLAGAPFPTPAWHKPNLSKLPPSPSALTAIAPSDLFSGSLSYTPSRSLFCKALPTAQERLVSHI